MLSFTKAKEFFLKNETKIVFLMGFILIAGVAFEAGYLKGKQVQEKAIVIEKPSQNPKIEPEGASSATAGNNGSPVAPSPNTVSPDKNQKNCVFVGSKNSNKFHVPTCQWAKRIKPENIVCFSSVEDAQAKGYQADKCVK